MVNSVHLNSISTKPTPTTLRTGLGTVPHIMYQSVQQNFFSKKLIWEATCHIDFQAFLVRQPFPYKVSEVEIPHECNLDALSA